MLEKTLSGIRVLDLTQNVAGPYCTQTLGDLGAEVIKIERPGRGDDIRDWRPPEIGGESATFLSLNRNKKSICIDIDAPEGQRLIADLARTADVFIHSMKPGSAEQRALGYDNLRAANPKLIYCAISAFGQVGPLKNLPGYDPLMQAFTGIISTLGHDGDDPSRVSVSLIDMGTGMWAALGIMAGLMSRQQSGEGMRVDASLMDTGIAWMAVIVAGFLASGKLPRRLGSGVSMTAPYELFRSSDGHVFIAAGNNRMFARVCEGLGTPGLVSDPRFLTNPLRVTNRDALRAEIEKHTMMRTTAENIALLRPTGTPCSELNDVSQMVAHEQVAASGMIAPLPVGASADHKVVALPLKADGARSRKMAPPPELGADTDAVLKALGRSDDEIASLRTDKTIG
jgi:crotonobetainyl-CoA:carnitine CoA-transferase CaiB-like acyl-CoA transferase